MYAVVKSGGKQAKVEKDAVITIEKLDAEVGQTVSLPVVLVSDGDRVLATPSDLMGASVSVEVLSHIKGDKQVVFKFQKRKGYKRTKGHRQSLTTVKVTDIHLSGSGRAAKPAAKTEKPSASKAAKPTTKAAKPAAAPKPRAVEKTKPAPKPKKADAAKAVSAEPGRCEAVKSDGTRCGNKAKEGSKYCGVHAKKYEG
jgi:large subunit ribosomal protein L21